MRFLLGFCVFVIFTSPTGALRAQSAPPSSGTSTDGARVSLWRGIKTGQTLQEVSAELTSYLEVKALKPRTASRDKPPSLKVSMKDGGVPIFGSGFAIEPAFAQNGTLRDVTLHTDQECANGAVDKANKIISVLSEKYGTEMTGQKLPDQLTVLKALSASYQAERSEVVTWIFANDEVAAIFIASFSRSKPPRYVGGSELSESLYNLAKALWESQKRKCENTGDELVFYAIQYMSRTDLDARAAAIQAEQNADHKQAGTNL